MKQKIVGTYQMGDDSVQVVLREGTGGDVYVQPGDIPYTRINVGADQDSWRDVVSVLLHEAIEGTTHGLLFVMDHGQLSAVCDRAGELLAACLPDVAKAWRQWKKGRKD